MNLAQVDNEKLDALPSRDSFLKSDDWYGRGRGPYWSHLDGFLRSRVGQHWNRIFSEYVHADWVPPEYKNNKQLRSRVELNTFMQDGEVCFYTNSKGYQYVKDVFSAVFYVHPETGLLCFKPAKPRVNYRRKYEIEEGKTMCILGDYHQLLKLNGIWYEVKGAPVQSKYIMIDGLCYKKAIYPNLAQRDSRCVIKNGEVYLPKPCPHFVQTIGPRERMIPKDSESRSDHSYYNGYETINLTLYKQLNRRQLKKYGLKNDPACLESFAKCKTCGSRKCRHHKTVHGLVEAGA